MIHTNLKKIIDKKHITQEEAADILGISQGGLNHILNGKRKIKFEFISLFCDRFGITFDELLSANVSQEKYKKELLVEVLTEIERWLDENNRELNPVDKIKLLFVLYDKVCDVDDSFERKVKLRTLIEVGYQMS